MPSLILLRHAKAAQALPGQRDFDRPLTERGRRDAGRMGAVLAAYPIDLAIVSAAARTRETWQIAASGLKSPPQTEIEPGLYLSGAQKLVQRIRSIPGTVTTALVVGHNPDTQEVALWLAGHDQSRAARNMREKFPTAAMAAFELGVNDWSEIGPQAAKLLRFLTPGELDD